jgi:hypothetical protein
MGYTTFSTIGSNLIKSEDIGPGQIELSHLSPSLFAELRNINNHTHSGSKSRQIQLNDLVGAFSKQGFYMWSSDATKRYWVTINSGTGAFVLTEA